jgi:hypothetical protein
MGGAGKWVKKNPLQAVGLLGMAVAAPYALPALFGGAGAAAAGGLAAGELAGGLGAGAAAEGIGSLAGGTLASQGMAGGLAGGLGAGAADEMLSAVPATMGDKFGIFAGNAMLGIDKMAPYAKLAGQAQGLLSPEQQPMPVAPPQGYRGPGQQLPMPSMYDDPDLKKRMAQMAQSGRFYG